MFEIREARLSLRSDISDIFTSGSIFSSVYNVYDESYLRAGTTPTFPFVYLLDSWVIFSPTHLPVIILETDYDKEGFELGNQPIGTCRARIYIFADSRGERDDLSGAIIENLTEVHVRDFDAVGNTIQSTSPLMPVSGRRVWITSDVPVPQELAFEKTLLNGRLMECAFLVY